MMELFQEAWAYVVDPEARIVAPFRYENGAVMSIREARMKGIYTGPPAKTEQDVMRYFMLLAVEAGEAKEKSSCASKAAYSAQEIEDMDLETAKAEISNQLYVASRLLEQLEYQGKVSGNGHHMRQAISTAGVEMVTERWRS